jgi:hypothetical protein
MQDDTFPLPSDAVSYQHRFLITAVSSYSHVYAVKEKEDDVF